MREDRGLVALVRGHTVEAATDGEGVGVGQRVGDEDRLEQQVQGQVKRQVLQDQEEQLIYQDRHDDKDET